MPCAGFAVTEGAPTRPRRSGRRGLDGHKDQPQPGTIPRPGGGQGVQATAQGKGLVVRYKAHAAVCARYDFPLESAITPANGHDVNYLTPLVEKFQRPPQIISADRGCDSSNSEEWDRTYDRRPSVEWVFSSLQGPQRPWEPLLQGLSKVRPLVQLCAIAQVAAELVEVKAIDMLPVAV